MIYRIVEERLPVLFDGGRRLRRIAAVTNGDTITSAFEHMDETWSITASQLIEDLTEVHDPHPLTAGSEQTARQWLELIARLYEGAS